MTLYETIFVRRSVRRYDQMPLQSETLKEIKNRLDGLKQLSVKTRARFEILPAAAVGLDKAPHYILAYCDDSPEAYTNVGYCLQETDLYLQSIGLGSLWLGSVKPKGQAAEDYCIMLAFGQTEVPFRSGENDFKRLSVKDISNEDNAVAQAARLAPSALNSQPWRFVFENEKIIVEYRGVGLLKPILKNKLSKIDIGIVTKHIEIALLKNNNEIQSITPLKDKKRYGTVIQYRQKQSD